MIQSGAAEPGRNLQEDAESISPIPRKTAFPNLGDYCSSKFRLVGLTQALAGEMRNRGIRVYAVCPGSTYTDLHRMIVGEEIARQSMAPKKVAEKILLLAEGKTNLPSGEAIIIDEQPPPFFPSKEKGKGWRLFKKYAGPGLSILAKIKDRMI